MTCWKLSPSDFTFLWEECKRCFYLKVVNKFTRPYTPFPKMFTKIDGIQKVYFSDKSSQYLSEKFKPGKVVLGEKWVESKPISFEGIEDTCFIKGKFDSVIKFDDNSYGVIDFKTAGPKSEHTPLYSRQLHSYAYALENAAENKISLSPIEYLGLICIDHAEMELSDDGTVIYKCDKSSIEFNKDYDFFFSFLRDVMDVLIKPDPPYSNSNCTWCDFRDKVRRTGY